MLKINKDLKDTALTILLEGRLDTTTAPNLEDVVKNELDGVKDLIFDLTMLEYISSAGLRILLSAQKTMNSKGTMIVKNTNEDIKEILSVTGFDNILTIE